MASEIERGDTTGNAVWPIFFFYGLFMASGTNKYTILPSSVFTLPQLLCPTIPDRLLVLLPVVKTSGSQRSQMIYILRL